MLPYINLSLNMEKHYKYIKVATFVAIFLLDRHNMSNFIIYITGDLMKKKLLIIFIVVTIVFAISFHYLYLSLVDPLKEYGKMEVERLNQLIITHSKFTDQKQYNDMVIIERNDNQEITLIDFDMVKANNLAGDIVLDIENTYSLLEEGKYKAKDDSYYERRLAQVSKDGIVSKVAIATLLDKPLLVPLSPRLSIRYKHLASVTSDVIKEVKNYGINHCMIQLSIDVTLKLRMVYPFFESLSTHHVTIPILLEIVEGQVPLVNA